MKTIQRMINAIRLANPLPLLLGAGLCMIVAALALIVDVLDR